MRRSCGKSRRRRVWCCRRNRGLGRADGGVGLCWDVFGTNLLPINFFVILYSKGAACLGSCAFDGTVLPRRAMRALCLWDQWLFPFYLRITKVLRIESNKWQSGNKLMALAALSPKARVSPATSSRDSRGAQEQDIRVAVDDLDGGAFTLVMLSCSCWGGILERSTVRSVWRASALSSKAPIKKVP